jgi:MFS family permease
LVSFLRACGNHLLILVLARLINGFGTGILNAIVPVWATESVPHTGRGQFIAIEFALNIFGVVVAYWLELLVDLLCLEE